MNKDVIFAMKEMVKEMVPLTGKTCERSWSIGPIEGCTCLHCSALELVAEVENLMEKEKKC